MKTDSGFTLVEVLIASVILFAAISISTGFFKSAIVNLDKVSMNISISEILPDVMESVKTDLFEGKYSGENNFGEHFVYSFKAEKKRETRNLRFDSNEYTGGFTYGTFLVSLVRVNLVIASRGRGSAKKSAFDYEELIWLKNNI